MKTLATIALLGLSFVAGQQQPQPDLFKVEVIRQRSVDPEFNGLHFQLTLGELERDEGHVGVFLTQRELKEAWNGKFIIE